MSELSHNHRYAFLLGRKPLLSLAELCAVLPNIGGGGRLEAWRQDIPCTVFSFSEAIDAGALLKRLGGTIKIMKIVSGTPAENLLAAAARREKNKLLFAINICGGKLKDLKDVLKKAKGALKEAGISSRFLNQEKKNVSNVAIFEEGLVETGTDLNLITIGDADGARVETLLGMTAAIQNFKEYGLRDYEKPFRDARAGMLPPKLAQIMVNVALQQMPPDSLTKKDFMKNMALPGQRIDAAILGDSVQHVYDPFCGTGTVLMEALLMGKNAWGSDIDSRMTEGAEKNLEWLKKTFHTDAADSVPRETPAFRVIHKDATTLTTADFPKDPFIIATETYLGPPLTSLPDDAALAQTMGELQTLYVKFFRNLKKEASHCQAVVIAFPCWRSKSGGYRFLPEMIEKVEALGYSYRALIPEAIANQCKIDLLHKGLIYDRPDQTVCRWIIKFVPR